MGPSAGGLPGKASQPHSAGSDRRPWEDSDPSANAIASGRLGSQWAIGRSRLPVSVPTTCGCEVGWTWARRGLDAGFDVGSSSVRRGSHGALTHGPRVTRAAHSAAPPLAQRGALD